MTVIRITYDNGAQFYCDDANSTFNTLMYCKDEPARVEVLEMSEDDYNRIPATPESYEASKGVAA